MFTGRYAVQAGRRVFPPRWNAAQIERMLELQRDSPVAMFRIGKRELWSGRAFADSMI
jgi:hypothetical protein